MRVTQYKLRKWLQRFQAQLQTLQYLVWLDGLSGPEAELVLVAIENHCLPYPHQRIIDDLRYRRTCYIHPESWGELRAAYERNYGYRDGYDRDWGDYESKLKEWQHRHQRDNHRVALLLGLLPLLQQDVVQPFLKPRAAEAIMKLVRSACEDACQANGQDPDHITVTATTIRASLLEAHQQFEQSYQTTEAKARHKMEAKLAKEKAEHRGSTSGCVVGPLPYSGSVRRTFSFISSLTPLPFSSGAGAGHSSKNTTKSDIEAPSDYVDRGFFISPQPSAFSPCFPRGLWQKPCPSDQRTSWVQKLPSLPGGYGVASHRALATAPTPPPLPLSRKVKPPPVLRRGLGEVLLHPSSLSPSVLSSGGWRRFFFTNTPKSDTSADPCILTLTERSRALAVVTRESSSSALILIPLPLPFFLLSSSAPENAQFISSDVRPLSPQPGRRRILSGRARHHLLHRRRASSSSVAPGTCPHVRVRQSINKGIVSGKMGRVLDERSPIL